MKLLRKLWHRLPSDIQNRLMGGYFAQFIIETFRIVKKPMVIRELSESGDAEKQEIANWLRRNKMQIFPYDFIYQYHSKDRKVFRDESGLPYIEFYSRKGIKHNIYAPADWTDKQVRDYFTGIMIEQDVQSPHCYFPDAKRMKDDGLVIADFGGAEGIFSLYLIEQCKRIYIFECDDKWIVPLEKTFHKWEDKVFIIQKCIGKLDDDLTVRMDTFFEDREIDCIKADIEGAEMDMIIGGRNTFERLKYVFMVAYHNDGDEGMIRNAIKSSGMDVKENKGYMLPWFYPLKFKRPYVRRGVVFGERK